MVQSMAGFLGVTNEVTPTLACAHRVSVRGRADGAVRLPTQRAGSLHCTTHPLSGSYALLG